jgi:hypothetical protein
MALIRSTSLTRACVSIRFDGFAFSWMKSLRPGRFQAEAAKSLVNLREGLATRDFEHRQYIW